MGIGNGTTLLEKSLRAVRQRVQTDRFVIIGQYDLALRRQDSDYRADGYEQCQASRYAPSEGSLSAVASSGSADLYAIANLTDSIVESLDGMAYFDVARNEQKPFVVGTNHINVKVLGTSFNVKTDESETEIVLEKGKVALCDGSGNSLAELVPGNRALLGHGDGIRLSSVQTSLYTKWRYSYKIYDSCSFDDFVSMIENRYDVRFIYDPSKFQNVYFRLAISETDTVDDMLAMMAYIARIQYEKNGRNIYVTVK